MTARPPCPHPPTELASPEQWAALLEHAGTFLLHRDGRAILAWVDEDGHVHGIRPFDEDDAHDTDPDPSVMAVPVEDLYDPDADPDTLTPAHLLWHDAVCRPTRALAIEEFTDWLATGQRGTSSEVIVSHLTGVPITTRTTAPRDPSDLRRCERLLRTVPAARGHLDRMSEVSPAWSALVSVWDELVTLAEQEAPGQIDAEQPSGAAPHLAARMRELTRAADHGPQRAA